MKTKRMTSVFHTSLFCGLAMCTAMSLPASCWADDLDEIQRQDLSLIQTHIEQIKLIIDRIEDRQQSVDVTTTRIFFDVPRFRKDLGAITHGIDDYLAPDRGLPRQPRSLSGDYLIDKGH